MILDFQPPPLTRLCTLIFLIWRIIGGFSGGESLRHERRYILLSCKGVPVIRLNSTARFKCRFHASNLSPLCFFAEDEKSSRNELGKSEIVGWNRTIGNSFLDFFRNNSNKKTIRVRII